MDGLAKYFSLGRNDKMDVFYASSQLKAQSQSICKRDIDNTALFLNNKSMQSTCNVLDCLPVYHFNLQVLVSICDHNPCGTRIFSSECV